MLFHFSLHVYVCVVVALVFKLAKSHIAGRTSSLMLLFS